MTKGERKNWPKLNESEKLKSKDVFHDRERKLVEIMQEDEKDGLYDVMRDKFIFTIYFYRDLFYYYVLRRYRSLNNQQKRFIKNSLGNSLKDKGFFNYHALVEKITKE